MHQLVRTWIVDVLKAHTGLLAVAMRQRAKFEGWLKFELAAHAEAAGATSVEVESGYPDGLSRSDLGFAWAGKKAFLELKTPNTNYRMGGVENKQRPITNNVAGIVEDARKLKGSGNGVVAFVLFPIPAGDSRWKNYLGRIDYELGIHLSEEEHCWHVNVPLTEGRSCEAIVCCFPVVQAKAG
jgi:hypothetical protein